MKIKITEEQANRLSLLNNDNDPIANIERFAKIKTEIVDALFSEVLNFSVGEIMDGEEKLELIKDRGDAIDSELRKLYNIAYHYVEDMGDPDTKEYSDEGYKLAERYDDANYTLSNKLNTLDNLVHSLLKLQELSVNREYFKWFKNVGPLDVTDI